MSDMINVADIVPEFKISEKEAVKALLNHANKTSYQLMSWDGNNYYIHQDVYDQIKKATETLLGYVIPEKDVIESAKATIPFNIKPILYFLLDDDVITYIGMTKNISMRIAAHLESKEFNKVATFHTPQLLPTVEAVNIYSYLPGFNKDVLTPEGMFSLTLANCNFEGEYD